MSSFSYRRRIFLLLCSLAVVLPLLLLPSQGAVAAGPVPVPEYKAKAAFVYNFALFSEWPDGGADEPFNVCLNSESPLRRAMEEFHGRPIKGRRLVVRALANIDNTRGCQIVYVGRLDHERWAQARKNIGTDSVLTISDDPDIGRDGAMITLALVDERVVFDIDMNAARQARLVLSSKLLRLARSTR